MVMLAEVGSERSHPFFRPQCHTWSMIIYVMVSALLKLNSKGVKVHEKSCVVEKE